LNAKPIEYLQLALLLSNFEILTRQNLQISSIKADRPAKPKGSISTMPANPNIPAQSSPKFGVPYMPIPPSILNFGVVYGEEKLGELGRQAAFLLWEAQTAIR